MGGYGSGRHCHSKHTTSDYLRLDIRRWRRDGWLTEGRRLDVEWTRNSRQIASITARVQSGVLILSYRNRRGEGPWEDLQYPIRLEWTPCRFGGSRVWCRCPAKGCGRRVAVLYGGRIFACRHCHDLAYRSQRERDYDRALTRAQNLHTRLGGTGSMMEEFPPKPKRMHWRTYERLQEQFQYYQHKSLLGAARRLGIL